MNTTPLPMSRRGRCRCVKTRSGCWAQWCDAGCSLCCSCSPRAILHAARDGGGLPAAALLLQDFIPATQTPVVPAHRVTPLSQGSVGIVKRMWAMKNAYSGSSRPTRLAFTCIGRHLSMCEWCLCLVCYARASFGRTCSTIKR